MFLFIFFIEKIEQKFNFLRYTGCYQ